MHPLGSLQQVLDALGSDPAAAVFARCEFPEEPAPRGWILGDAVAVERTSHSGRNGIALIGGPDQIVRLVDELVARSGFGSVDSLTLPRSVFPQVSHRLSLTSGGDWDWLHIDIDPPAQAAEDRLVALDDLADADELTALNELGNPTAESYPGSGRTELWLGIRDPDGRILAAGAMHRTAGGAPHLSGIVTHPDHRGLGLGNAVIAGLTRAALQRPGPISGVCTLGMYADNDTARRQYHRLGYRTDQQFASRLVVPSASGVPVS